MMRASLKAMGDAQCILDFQHLGLHLHTDGMLNTGALMIHLGQHIVFNTVDVGFLYGYYCYDMVTGELEKLEGFNLEGKLSLDKKYLFQVYLKENKLEVSYLKASNFFTNKWNHTAPSELYFEGPVSLKVSEAILTGKTLYIPALSERDGYHSYAFDLTDLGNVNKLPDGAVAQQGSLGQVADSEATKVYKNHLLTKMMSAQDQSHGSGYMLCQSMDTFVRQVETLEGKYQAMQVSNCIYLKSQTTRRPSKWITFKGSDYQMQNVPAINLDHLFSANEMHYAKGCIYTYYKPCQQESAYIGLLQAQAITGAYDPEGRCVTFFKPPHQNGL